MDKPDKSLNDKNESKRLISRKSIMDWKPDRDLSERVKQSWGLEALNERPSDTRS